MELRLSQRFFIRYIFRGLYGFLIISAIVSSRPKRTNAGMFYFTKREILILAWVIVPLFIYVIIDIFIYPILGVVRYIGFIHIPLAILISRGASQYNLKVKWFLLGSLIFITFLGLLYPYYKHNWKYNRENWRGLFNVIHQKAEKNALVLATNLNISKGAKYYNHGKELGWAINGEVDRKWIDKNYESIFVIHRGRLETKIPEGYFLAEDYYDRKIGFLWFKKIL